MINALWLVPILPVAIFIGFVAGAIAEKFFYK
jgi:hypothetical protein